MISDHLTPEVRDALFKGAIAVVATADPDGVPNLAPKGTLRAVDDLTLVYAELHPGRTADNLARNPRVAVAVQDPETMAWYQVKGRAERETAGRHFRGVCADVAGLPIRMPLPRAAVVIHVEEMFALTPGRAPALEVVGRR
jgi:predicted pyridoxine 5'-phosphate oxidase superfamily flavin-nucleotide-binding protein